MATEAEEVGLLEGGIDANGATKGQWAQNLFWRNDALEVRPAFGQIHQFDSRLRMPPSQAFVSGGAAAYGHHAVLGAYAFVTNFGHVQVVTLLSQQTWTGNSPLAGDWMPTLALHVWDATTRTAWQEPLHIHTAKYVGSPNPLYRWLAYQQSNYDLNAAGPVRGMVEGSEASAPDPADNLGVFFTEFDDAVFFGAPWLGLWVYRPSDFLGHAEWTRDTTLRQDFPSPRGESACVFPIQGTTGAFSDAYAYLDTVAFPSPVDACAFAGGLAICDGAAVYFTDPGRPNAIVGLNVLTVAPNERLVGLMEANGNLLIWSRSETFLFQPAGSGLTANGQLTKLSNDCGLINAQCKVKVAGGVAWADYAGVFTSNGTLAIKELAESIAPLFNGQLTSPWSSYFTAAGVTDLTAEQPRSFFDLANTRGMNIAFDQVHSVLLLSIPAHRLVMALQGGKWSAWTFDTVIHFNCFSTPAVGATGIPNVHLTAADGRLFAVAGCETYSPADVVKVDGVVAGINDPSRSAYILEWGHGGALDRSVARQEDNRDVAGWWEPILSSGATPPAYADVDDYSAFYIGQPKRLPAGYNVLRGGPVGANEEVWAYPVYCRPDWTIAALPPSKLELWFNFDKTKWEPVLVAVGNPEIAAMLPPERIASMEGWGIGAPVAGSEIQLYDSGTLLPSVAGDQVRCSFDGTVGATPWHCKPNMNLSPRRLNPIMWLPFRRIGAGYTSGLGLSLVSATTTTPPAAATLADVYYWHQPSIQDLHGNDDTAQPIDWAYKSKQISEEDALQIKTRGVYLRVIQHGKGTDNAFTSWPWGLINAVVGCDWKDWTSQIIDHTNGAIRLDAKDPSLRSRFKDSAATAAIGQRVFNSPDAKPPTFGTTADGAKGNYLVDEEQLDTVAISDECRGEFLSWMLFGHIRDKAERLVLHSAKATIRKVAGRRRGGTLMRSELPAVGAPPSQLNDRLARDALAALVNALGQTIVQAGKAITEPRNRDNMLLLLAGEHGGAALTKPNTELAGAPGAIIARQVTCAEDARLRGLRFVSTVGSNNVSAPLLVVKAGATVLVSHCTFERQPSDKTDWISVESGGKLILQNVLFTGPTSTGSCVNNAGVAANVGIIASNKTGRPIGAATTAIFVTT